MNYRESYFVLAVFHVTVRLLSYYANGYRCWRAGVRFPGPSNWTQSRQQLATAAIFLRNCVAQALSRGDEPRHSLRASA